MRKLLPFIAFLAGLPLASAQQASDSSFYQLTIEDLTKITVASNVITQKEKQPVSVTTITGEQLRMSGARVLSEALTMFVPGFFAIEDQDDMIAGFRGLAADNNSKVMLLVNGQNLNTEFFWGPADAILNSTNFEYIDRIEVIRGPGSVTLGQGALMGVINIVTKQGSQIEGTQGAKSEVVFKAGADTYLHGSADVQAKYNNLNAYFYLSTARYNGQQLRNEGWAAVQNNSGYAGGKVFDMGHRLHRTDNMTMMGHLAYKGFELNIVYADQIRDLYNFYRDREVFQQIVTAIQGSYQHKFSSRERLTVTASYAQDHFGLYSLTGTTMGGTREDRFGGKAVFNADNFLTSGNKLAVGVETRQFQMGKRNLYNNNFIANIVNTFDPATANEDLTMGYQKNINVVSVFLEDFYSVNKQLDFFLAIRNDNHPFWGNSFTPRLGVLYAVHNDLRFRLSYQSGFRGAVGLHYTGGYRRDGFLRAENYEKIAEANIPIPEQSGEERNVPTTLPERMNSVELAGNYKINSKLQIEAVAFYTSVENVIDVGVIYRDPSFFQMVDIGSDIPGDWNGYWFFKNTPGRFNQAGLEATFSYTTEKISASISHATVQVAQATNEQAELAKNSQSMYLSDDNGSLRFKAYPQGVTRVHASFKPMKNMNVAANILSYSKWFSPIGTAAEGGTIINLSASYTFAKRFSVTLIGKNLLSEANLYPMNSNAGGPDVSPGTPAWEQANFWIRLGVALP